MRGERIARSSAAACVLGWLLFVAQAGAAIEWPQEITAPEGTIIVYQPQPEQLKGNVLSGRAAMSLELKGRKDAVFGAFWFDAKIDTDADIVTVRDLKVTKVRWPESTDANEQRFTAVVEGAVPDTGFQISLERLSASLESAEVERESLAGLKNDPPRIIFSEELAVLLLYDGEPRFSPVENSPYERALNTPFAVARQKSGGILFLTSGNFWYAAKNPLGPWTLTQSPPQDLAQMMPKSDAGEPAPKKPPAIVAASEPTELIVTQGKAAWKSLPGGKLLYVENTETPWLRELSTNNMYLLLSGRWYRSKSQDGPWTFVRADELPASFADIPPASDIGGLRASVAGTDEAEDAMLDAHIPQTAAIKRSEAKLEVQYDGEPKFEKISGTNVSHAANTGAQVLQIGGRYYAVDNGVWFTSATAKGPWAVADSVPSEEIEKIPPSSPVYNTTYVQIYDSTPEVVYVGYTPGYLWSFPHYGVPVYGTGWYYPPYWGSVYYPRPPTWGFHVGYNPWTGWNFGVSWSSGFFSLGVSWGGGWRGPYRPWGCCGGWYGGGYRGPTFINTGDINIGNNVNIGNRTKIKNRIDRDTNFNRDRSQTNLYNRAQNRTRNADRTTARANLKQARPATNRANDVFADRNGNVAKRTNDRWQSRENGKWKSAGGAGDRAAPGTRDRTQPATRDRATPTSQTRQRTQPAAPSRNIDRSSLNRSHQSRQRGMSREAARPSSMGMGGGRGRRR